MSDKKLGKAGKHYELTPKALEFVEKLEAFCDSKGIPKSEIPTILKKLAEEMPQTLEEAQKSLMEKGFIISLDNQEKGLSK